MTIEKKNCYYTKEIIRHIRQCIQLLCSQCSCSHMSLNYSIQYLHDIYITFARCYKEYNENKIKVEAMLIAMNDELLIHCSF